MPVQKLSTFADFERQQQAFVKQMKKHDLECISCPSCGSQFFEELEVAKFKASHNVILGQPVPIKPGSQPYILLKCIYCGDLLEPRVDNNTRDVLHGDYDQLLDTIEGKLDNRKKEEKKENAVQAEEL